MNLACLLALLLRCVAAAAAAEWEEASNPGAAGLHLPNPLPAALVQCRDRHACCTGPLLLGLHAKPKSWYSHQCPGTAWDLAVALLVQAA